MTLTTKDDEILLSVQNLTIQLNKDDGEQVLVNNLNFELNKGKVLGIVGESGSGKSISSLALMGLLRKPLKIGSGNLKFKHSSEGIIDLAQQSEAALKRIRGAEIGMIFQEPMTSLNPAYTCGNQILEAVLLHQPGSAKSAKATALKWLERVQINDPLKAFKSYPHQLSGGQRQRVMIAMAMACRPSLLIADEPTTALDVTVQRTILELMKDLQTEFGMSIIFITHDLGVISEISDELVVMNKGRIVEAGTTKEVLNNPKDPYTAGLLGCRPPMNAKLKRLPVMDDFVSEHTAKNGLDDVQEALKVDAAKWKNDRNKLYEKPPLLEAKNLLTRYITSTNWLGKPTDYYEAVKSVSLKLYRGETLGLVGESGCGKTSLGRSILKLVENGEGDVIYNGTKLDATDPTQIRTFRKKVQLVFQDPYSSLNPSISIGQAVMEPLKVHAASMSLKEKELKARSLLDQVGLPSSAFERYPHEFSGGQRQRVGIARALALEPEILICDESVSALDMSVQAQVLNLLNDLKEEFQLTYLFISHDLSVVKYMSDRVIVMKGGKIEEEGLAEELYENPKSDYTRKLINAIPVVH